MDICLALGGGGIKGVAHIGVLDCLEKAGFKVRAIAGSSAGGLAGAVYAAGYSPMEILAILESINKNRMYARQPADGPSLLGYAGLAEALVEVLGESTFADLKIPFACTAVDLHSCQEMYLNEGCVVEAVLATIAIPGVFPPKIRGAAELIDGAVLDPVPVRLARWMAPRLPVIAVVLNPPEEAWQNDPQFNSLPPVPLPIPAPIIEGFARMRIGQSLRIYLHSIDISARMLTELRLKADQPDVIIRPDVAQYGMLDVVEPKKLVEAGSLAAETALPRIRKALSWTERTRRAIRAAQNTARRESRPPEKPSNGGANPISLPPSSR